jgi:hypothetical protein
MKKSSILCCAALSLAVLACGTTATTATTVTEVPTAWKDPAYSGPGFARIFVIAVHADDGKRRLFEDHLARELAKHRVVAEPSYTHLPDTSRLSEGAVREAIADGDFDGVTITRLVGREQTKTYVPGSTHEEAVTPTGGYYGYYRTSWEVVHEPGYYKTNTTVRLETTLYDLQNRSKVWDGKSDTMNSNSVADTIESATRAIAKQMKKDGVLR